jgi:hypothetical protein
MFCSFKNIQSNQLTFKFINMKKLFFIPFLMSIFTFGMTSCSSDDDASNNPSINQVNANVSSGTWRVILFSEDGVNHTSDFAGYNFLFASNNLMSAENESTTVEGTWITGTDDSNPKMILSFDVFAGPFEEISEDWRILSSTSTKLELRHVSGGDGSIDLLTFQKN